MSYVGQTWPPLRVAAISFLNAAPLMDGLETDSAFRLEFTTPSGCADSLASGQADIGLIPVIEMARIGGLAAVPGLAVAASREVRSILLVTPGPVEATHTLLVDPASRTSAVLAQLLLRGRFGARIERVVAPKAGEPAVPRAGEARLVIGDPALRMSVLGACGNARPIDLASAWYGWTGLPFVFAVWGVRVDAVAGRETWLTRRLLRARHEGREDTIRLAAEWSRRLDLPTHEIERYLSQDVQYDLTDAHLRGMRHFFSLAANAGLAPDTPIHWLNGAETGNPA